MLKLTLLPEEYLTINDSVVIQLKRVAGGRADLAIDAPREFPILRGTVLERSGGQRPGCLAPPTGKRARTRRDQIFRWNDDRERAVRAMKQALDRLEQKGSGEEAQILRTQLDRIIPTFWEDDLAAKRFCERLQLPCIDASPFVLEGGSIHCDGEGTILTTEACLLSTGRNPSMDKIEIERALCNYLGGKKVIWLPHGIYGDETNEHVDNICAFIKPGVVALAWTDDKEDVQYAYSKECYEVLCRERDAKGRKFQILKLPIPQKPVLITEEECNGFVFEEGEDKREPGERLAASYVNFYIANNSIILPQFGDENDAEAVRLLREAFPDRKIVPVMARSVIVGGGNIHCITQQIPKGSEKKS